MKDKKTCLVIYLGAGYSEHLVSHDGVAYSIDMRNTRQNHAEMIYAPLVEKGYKIDKLLLTQKHEHYEQFMSDYNAIRVEYDDLTPQEESILHSYYFHLKITKGWGPGSFKTGGRFLKLKQPIPEYDLYVFIRADVQFKLSLSEMNVDYEKINYLWPETDSRFYTNEEDFKRECVDFYGSDDRMLFWDLYNRVNGIAFNVVPKKFFNVFTHYLWADHVSLHLMLKELYPLVSLNDVNMICGTDKCYVSDVKICDNPIYTFNKTFLNRV